MTRLALTLDEAAASLGVSRDYFDEHVRPELRVIRRGRRVLVSVKELERWLDKSAALALAEHFSKGSNQPTPPGRIPLLPDPMPAGKGGV